MASRRLETSGGVAIDSTSPAFPAGASRRARLVAAGVVLLVLLGAWLGLVWLTTADARKVAELVGKELGCPPDKVTVLSSAQSDTGEVYEFEACGQHGRALCAAPDFRCTVMVGR